MALTFQAVAEDTPGPKWSRQFDRFRAAYLKWWASEGLALRPTYTECRRAFHKHMPEILPLYDELCELAGGGDMEARFLSLYCPPRYKSGCSQAIWPGEAPMLVRNYDYDPNAFDAVILKTRWQGRGVIGTADGMFGLLDGMNDAGLAVSLTFGGRQAHGRGFGVPIILRYLLQTCETAKEAGEVLKRVPSHMTYNVTVLDKTGAYVTAYLAPDRETILAKTPVATNHQERVEWQSHARETATVERERYLLHKLTLHPETQAKFIRAFLQPPLYSLAFATGFGTLYTAAYHPSEGKMACIWQGRSWEKSFEDFPEDAVAVTYPSVVNHVPFHM